MNKVEQGIPAAPNGDDEEKLYRERASFIKDEYPIDESDQDIEDLLASGLDGKEILEKRDGSGDIESILTYDIAEDSEGTNYCSIGIALTREESRGEGAANELYLQAIEIAKDKGCEYAVAIADTQAGQDFLLKNGFTVHMDEVNGREHFRLDLD